MLEFNLFRRQNTRSGQPLLTDSFSLWIDDRIPHSVFERYTSGSINVHLYAMTGWSLAECVRLSYEHFKK